MDDTSYINYNQCYSFNQSAGGTLAALSGNQVCSEVIVYVTGNTTFYDNSNPSIANGFLVPANGTFTFRGLTNCNQLSATGSGIIYYRTQYYSFNAQVLG